MKKNLILYLTSLTRAVLTPSYIFIFFAPIFVIIIIIQSTFSKDISELTFNTLFLGMIPETEKDLLKIFSIYSFVFSLVLEIYSRINRRKKVFSLKNRLYTSYSYFFIVFLLFFFALLFEGAGVKDGKIFAPFIFLLSMIIISSITIPIDHSIVKLRDIIEKYA